MTPGIIPAAHHSADHVTHLVLQSLTMKLHASVEAYYHSICHSVICSDLQRRTVPAHYLLQTSLATVHVFGRGHRLVQRARRSHVRSNTLAEPFPEVSVVLSRKQWHLHAPCNCTVCATAVT
jgi:hypothetical protein